MPLFVCSVEITGQVSVSKHGFLGFKTFIMDLCIRAPVFRPELSSSAMIILEIILA